MMGLWDLRTDSGRGMLPFTDDIWMLACRKRASATAACTCGEMQHGYMPLDCRA